MTRRHVEVHAFGELGDGESPVLLECSLVRQAATGLGISGLNPKVLLLFLALLPQLTDPEARWPLAAQIMALGLVHVASCALVYTAVAPGPGGCCRHDLPQRGQSPVSRGQRWS